MSQGELRTPIILSLANSFRESGCLWRNATWNLNPTNTSWDTADNWTPATVPDGSSDVATFGASNQRTISFQQNITLDSIVFTPDARSFLFVHDRYFPCAFVLAITGEGIVNNSATTQNFTVQANIADRVSVLEFLNSASSGSLMNYVVEGGTSASEASANIFPRTLKTRLSSPKGVPSVASGLLRQ
jgi:hypothetical protein